MEVMYKLFYLGGKRMKALIHVSDSCAQQHVFNSWPSSPTVTVAIYLSQLQKNEVIISDKH